jgi:medium-chain acyl-[acyl-carrier-protein] hydrolase
MTIANGPVAPSGSWIRPYEPRSLARLRMFCLPFAGGGSVAFWSWLRALPADVELCAVCLPGREDRRRERPFDRLEPLVAELAQAMAGWTDRPFVLYGHSMGGLIGFELARALHAAGTPPRHLIISARGAPDLPLTVPRLAELPDAQFVAALSQRYNGIPQVILDDPDMLAMFVPVLRADFAVLESYAFRPGPPLGCPITAFGGTRDPLIGAAELVAWQRHTTSRFRHEMIEGDHFFIQGNQARFLSQLSEELHA